MHKFIKLVTFAAVVAATAAAGAGDTPPSSWAWLGFAREGGAVVLPRPLRSPAVPLVTCDPFFSVWSPHDRLTDGDTTHWAAWKTQPLSIVLEADGATYRLCGTEPASAKALRQLSCEVRPLTTVVSYEGDDGLAATLEFLTAKDPDDLEAFSRPVTYVTAKVTCANVWSLRVWFGPNICREDENAPVTTNSFVVSRHHLGVWLGRTEQHPLSASGDTVRCDWGYAWTVDCGDHFVLGYDDVKSIRWFDQDLNAYWRRNGRTFESMLADSVRDYAAVRERADRKDAELMSAFRRRGGEKYARLCALAWRQSFAACKLVVGPKGELFYFSKENGSNGCIGTVDVFYPQMPLLLYSSKELVRATLRPILEYASSGRWPYDYAPHDIGQYPLATGQVYGMGNDSRGRPYGDADRMPVEECGNMLISLAALAQREGNADFAGRYWPTVVKWAEYLSRFGFDPGDQLCTDDFAGHLAHNANLSLKSILAIRSYAMLAEMREKAQGGGSGESEKWRRDAERMAKSWMDAAKGGRDGATRLAFDQADTWSLKYNLVWDRVLGFNLFPAEVARGETAAYRKFANDFGVPLDSRRTYTKSDWIMWCAAMAEDRADFDALVSGIYRFANETPSRVPLSDWYETVGEGRFVAFIARSVVGGFLMPML